MGGAVEQDVVQHAIGLVGLVEVGLSRVEVFPARDDAMGEGVDEPGLEVDAQRLVPRCGVEVAEDDDVAGGIGPPDLVDELENLQPALQFEEMV